MSLPADARARLACVVEPSRFRIIRRLLERPSCVSDLALGVGLSQSCTTRHLQALDHAGLVRRTRAGKRVLYRPCLEDPEVAQLLVLVTADLTGPWGETLDVPPPAPAQRETSGRRARPSPQRKRSDAHSTEPSHPPVRHRPPPVSSKPEGGPAEPSHRSAGPSAAAPPPAPGEASADPLSPPAPGTGPRPGDLEDFLL